MNLSADKAYPTFVFDAETSAKFHDVVSTKTLGDPVILSITLRALDSGNGGISKAKAMNLESNKEFNLYINSERGFAGLRKYLKKRNPPPFVVIGCPILEYGAFDPLAGDMYLIAVAKSEVTLVDEVDE